MRFLVDEGVDVRIIGALRRLGHDARRVPAGTTNGSVMRLALRESRALITRDSDCANTATYPPDRTAGIIYLAIHPPWLKNLLPPLKQFLQERAELELAGSAFIYRSFAARKAG